MGRETLRSCCEKECTQRQNPALLRVLMDQRNSVEEGFGETARRMFYSVRERRNESLKTSDKRLFSPISGAFAIHVASWARGLDGGMRSDVAMRKFKTSSAGSEHGVRYITTGSFIPDMFIIDAFTTIKCVGKIVLS